MLVNELRGTGEVMNLCLTYSTILGEMVLQSKWGPPDLQLRIRCLGFSIPLKHAVAYPY